MRLLLLPILLFSLVGCASNWSKMDIAQEGVYLAAHTVDYFQTKEILGNPDFHEMNPLINENNVEAIFIATSLSHLAISNWLSKEKRTFWQTITNVVAISVIGHNYQIGIRF